MHVMWNGYQVDPQPVYAKYGRAVYLGADPRTGQQVTIKTTTDVPAAAYEAQIMQRYGVHPHLIRFIDYFVAGDMGHIVMERHAGKPLGYWRYGPRRSAKTAVGITLSVLDGLSHLHRHGLLHTDVMPHNVMVEADDPHTVKVIDFGTAVETDGAGQFAGIHKGATTGFRPPEIRRAKWSVLDRSADVFEAACLCTYLLTGRAPVDAGAALARVSDPGLRGVLAKAMCPDRSRRFATCADLAAALSPLGGPG